MNNSIQRTRRPAIAPASSLRAVRSASSARAAHAVAIGVAVCIGLAAWAGASSCASTKPRTVAADDAGRFFYETTPGLIQETTDGSYRKYRLDRPKVEGYIVATAAPSEAEGIAASFLRIGAPYGEMRLDGVSSYREWRLWSYAIQGEDGWKAAATQYRGGTLYAFIVEGGADTSADSLPPPFMRMLTSFRFTAKAGERFSPRSFPDLERYIDAAIAPSGGAVSVAAIRDGVVVYRYSSGKLAPGVRATPDAALHWGSIAKLVTGAAVMREAERGRIDLDAPIDRYIPVPASVGRVTVRQLLSHASGLPGEPEALDSTGLVYFRKEDMPPLEAVWRRYVAEAGAPLFVPGTASRYNNFNFLALGVILEKATGRHLTDYAEAEIFAPLGMRNTAYFSEDLPERTIEALPAPNRLMIEEAVTTLVKAGYRREDTIAAETGGVLYFRPLDILSAWGGVKGTAEDAARFGWMFLNGGSAGMERVLEPKTVAAMEKAQTAADGSALPFGLAVRVFAEDKEACVGHDGGGPGIESTLRIYPRHKLVVAVLGSTEGYGADTIAEHVKDILSDPRAADIDRSIIENMDKSKVQGLAALILRDGKVAWTGEYGYADAAAGAPVTAETIFPIASITKTITGTAIMQLYEDGLVDLDESIDAYLPFKVRHPRYPATKITLRMLLQHRSGIADNEPVVEGVYTIKTGSPDPEMSLDEFLRSYAVEGGTWYDAMLNFTANAPGAEFRYSNVGFALVGYIVERMTGKPFNEYCKERIFAPLGMDSTGFYSREIDASKLTLNYYEGRPLKPYSYATYPDGGLRTTTRDYAKFLLAIMNGGETDGRRILQASTVEAMLPEDPSKRLIWELDPLKDFRISARDRTMLGHTGGDPGIVTAAYFNRDNRTAVIVFLNTIPPSPSLYRHIRFIVEKLNERAGL